MNWHYGDVVLVGLDPSKGHEQAKQCPAVVVSNDGFNRNCSTTVVIPISHGRPDFELHQPLKKTKREDGEGWIDGYTQIEQIRALDLSAREARRIGRLCDEDMDVITSRILGCYVQPNMMVIPV